MKKLFAGLASLVLIFLIGCLQEPKELVASNDIESETTDRFRPKLHFTPPQNWMNDPNGMFYYDGEYHLFYQHNPFGNQWGHMSWGHAVSEDMITWEHLPIAMQEEEGVMIFSGSAVVDWNNTSGFGKNSEPPIVAIYTSYDSNDGLQHQSIAYSNDKGRSFTKYEGNPVLDLKSKDFRDPKVFWYEDEKKWVMSVALSADRKIQFYESRNLIDWQFMSEFGPYGAVKGVWECPDLFQLTTPEGETKWILQVDLGDGSVAGGSGGQYFIGDFDGRKFVSMPITENKRPKYKPKGEIIDDFEGGFDFWSIEGKAFGESPAIGSVGNQQQVKDFAGKGFLNSFHGGDDATGKMVSKKFTINKKFINLLVGGGAKSGVAEIALLIDDKKIKTATGSNSEPLTWTSWHVEDFIGKEAHLEVIDNATGGWGHLNVDHIIQSDVNAYNVLENANWLDYGKDFYAAVTWSDIPNEDGRKLWLGWMNNWQYANEIPTGEVWRSHMSIPREVQLRKNGHTFYLVQQPVKEFEAYKSNKKEFKQTDLVEINKQLESLFTTLNYELDFKLNKTNLNKPIEFKIESAAREVLTLKIETIGDALKLSTTRPSSGNIDFNSKFVSHQEKIVTSTKPEIDVRIIVDKSSVEIFADTGSTVFTNLIFPQDDKVNSRFISTDTNASIDFLSAFSL